MLIESPLIEFDQSIKIHTDRSTPFFAINKQGSSKSLEVIKAVGRLCDNLKLKNSSVEMLRISTNQNVLGRFPFQRFNCHRGMGN